MFRTETPRLVSSPALCPAGKKSQASSKNLALRLKSFEENLLVRLKSLNFDPNQPSISLSWLSSAIDVLTSTHADAERLISDLKISGSGKVLISYMDDSLKILDVCNSISSEIERLRQGRLLIHFILHLLSDCKMAAPENLRRARDSINEYGKCSPPADGTKRRSLASSVILIRDLARGMETPTRGKVSSVKKILTRAIYAVSAVTVFIAGVVVAVLSGSGETIGTRVSGEVSWGETFNSMERAISGEVMRRSALQVDALEKGLKKVAEVIDEVAGVKVYGGETEKLGEAVKEMEKLTEEFSDGLERLANGVNEFFRVVLCTRNAVLENFR